MAGRGRDDEKPFLSRWSQRKRQAEEEARAAEAAAAREAEEAETAAAPEEIDPAQLPDIDSLDASADFTVFMREGVPKALKQRALRRLWQVDPAFKHICMLDDYNQDFTDAAMVVPNLKTIYQVGRGMVLPEEELEKAAGGEAAPPAPALPAADSAVAGEPVADDAGEKPAALASPEPADAPGQEVAQLPEADESQPGAEADLPEAGRDAESASTNTPISVGSRGARRRRWGDTGA